MIRMGDEGSGRMGKLGEKGRRVGRNGRRVGRKRMQSHVQRVQAVEVVGLSDRVDLLRQPVENSHQTAAQNHRGGIGVLEVGGKRILEVRLALVACGVVELLDEELEGERVVCVGERRPHNLVGGEGQRRVAEFCGG